MNYLDTLYRALIDYRKNTLQSNDCKGHRTAIVAADPENDLIEVTRKNCTIEDDWIEAIEKGLEFIDKAIREERQFIRSNGEVIPIEKVKRVSKDSVEHLARHSNFFTRAPKEGEDMIPEHLYTVERLSDYAVYENRFLYMLLCYLRDFIGMRYEKIVEMTNTYNGKMEMRKEFSESTRRVKYELRLEEEKKNDEYLREHNKAQKEIDRILTIYKVVIIYLGTPLMVEVAKSPMVKPPIMRTNVLKMNRNFREALSLYEYITAYDKDGYVITTETRTISPFNSMVGDEIAEAVDLAFFLTYEHGLGIKDYLKEEYEKEENRRREEERAKLAEQIRGISRHLSASGLTPEQYIRLLEKRIKDMEKEEEELNEAHRKIDALHEEIHKLHDELEENHAAIRSLGREIERLNKKYADDMAAIELRRTQRLREVQTAYEQRIQGLQMQYDNQIGLLTAQHEEDIRRVQSSVEELQNVKATADAFHMQELNRISEERSLELLKINEEHAEKLRTITEDYEAKSDVLNSKVNASIQKLNEMQRSYDEMVKHKAISDARLLALRSEYGLIGENEDFTTKEQTDELEHQYEMFRLFYKKEWKKTKQRIKAEVYAKNLELKKKKKEKSLQTEENLEETETISQEQEMNEETAVETPVVEESKVEETLVVEESKAEETPVVEESKAEETPVAEESKVEESPVVEESNAVETPVEAQTENAEKKRVKKQKAKSKKDDEE
ncbi:MAG: DUF2357 domain-containing protein [Clostridia bacterium]|nr:DUF2357 domain-containing protein [Clostridia bacterium]